MLHQAHLAGKSISFQLKRSHRRTVGLKINRRGLQVSAPFDLAASEINALLQTKTNWILKKLALWQSKTPLSAASGLVHAKNEYPFLGKCYQPQIKACGQIQMVAATDNQVATPADSDGFPKTEPIQKWISIWYQQQAIICFSERIAFFSDKLNVPKPPFKLSQAKTRWGSCNNHGMIRLNWRLIQLPLHLVDYVIAHELCHLIEMNHSPAFWHQVAGIYPNYQQARHELRSYTCR